MKITNEKVKLPVRLDVTVVKELSDESKLLTDSRGAVRVVESN